MRRQATREGTSSLISRVYDAAETLLWAGLVAFVIYFVAFIAPQIPKNRAIQDAVRLHAIAAEQDFYCEKWGKAAGTPEHAACVLDLQQIRAKIERELTEENSF